MRLKCDKCPGGRMLGPRYEARRDLLVYVCGTCGYQRSEIPRDRFIAKGHASVPSSTHAPQEER